MTKMASLVLEDGTTFTGLLFGADVSVSGEVGESRTHLLGFFVRWVGPVADSLGPAHRGLIVLLFVILSVIRRPLWCHGDRSAKTSLVSLQQRGFLLAVTIVEEASRHQQRLESILFVTHCVLGSCRGRCFSSVIDLDGA